MQLNRRELTVLSAIVLGWACLPLGIHFLAPQYSDQTGPVMLGGGVVAALAAFQFLWVHSQRLVGETTRRLAAFGFVEVSLPFQPDLSWFPAEHRAKNPRIDGFAVAGNDSLRSVYQRNQKDVRTTLFGYRYSTGGPRSLAGFQAVRFECPNWNWPSFSAARADASSQGFPVEGWTRVQFPEDPRFSRDWWIQAPHVEPVRILFSAPVRDALENHADFRVSAEGQLVTVYCAHLRLVPGEAEQLLEHAGQLVTSLTQMHQQP
ncbi:MAG: hypothetical protein J0M24_19095 [Verrucomicrobia bacterium]|nr:hypothetical protein [Verrucomicrobiota bacterium]